MIVGGTSSDVLVVELLAALVGVGGRLDQLVLEPGDERDRVVVIDDAVQRAAGSAPRPPRPTTGPA